MIFPLEGFQDWQREQLFRVDLRFEDAYRVFARRFPGERQVSPAEVFEDALPDDYGVAWIKGGSMEAVCFPRPTHRIAHGVRTLWISLEGWYARRCSRAGEFELDPKDDAALRRAAVSFRHAGISAGELSCSFRRFACILRRHSGNQA